MPNITLAPAPATRADSPPPSNTSHIPPWVLDKTGMGARTLRYWRDQGYLTPPGSRHRVGTGRRFDWHAALEQIGWLARLHHDCILDQEDADAGWRLRAAGCEIAVRHHPGPWIPVDTMMAAKPLLTAGTVITVAQVRAS